MGVAPASRSAGLAVRLLLGLPIESRPLRTFEPTPELVDEMRRLVEASGTRSVTAGLVRMTAVLAQLPPHAVLETERYLTNVRVALGSSASSSIAPAAAPALMLNRNGFVREAALAAMATLPDSPFFVAALVCRLNDWVPEVRCEAERCARRVLPGFSPKSIAAAAPFLLARMLSWTRWGPSPPAIVLETLSRPDCAEALANHLAVVVDAPLEALRVALRLGLIDVHLASLARTARRPEMRALVLKVLIERELTWVQGYDREWADKRFGRTRRVPVLSRRPVGCAIPREELIRQGALDRSVLARYAAAQGLVAHEAELGEAVEPLMRLFDKERNSGIRWLMDFLARRRSTA